MKKFRVSIVQTYILQLKHAFIISRLRRKKFQLYKLTSFNWNSGAITYRSDLLSVSIVQTYILQLKREEKVIARLPLLGFNCTNLHPSTETYGKLCGNVYGLSFNCTNLHPSTETNWRRISEGKDSKFQLYKLTSFNWNKPLIPNKVICSKFQLYKLTSFNWNSLPCNYFQLRFCFNCTNLHPSTETEATSWTLHFH